MSQSHGQAPSCHSEPRVRGPPTLIVFFVHLVVSRESLMCFSNAALKQPLSIPVQLLAVSELRPSLLKHATRALQRCALVAHEPHFGR
jgi:hypothetical protein